GCAGWRTPACRCSTTSRTWPPQPDCSPACVAPNADWRDDMQLYGFFRSSAAYRVRIALALKGLSADLVSVHLGKGQQYGEAFSAVSPQNLVPVLEDAGQRMFQSLAIIEYLEERYPEPALLPRDPFERARVR